MEPTHTPGPQKFFDQEVPDGTTMAHVLLEGTVVNGETTAQQDAVPTPHDPPTETLTDLQTVSAEVDVRPTGESKDVIEPPHYRRGLRAAAAVALAGLLGSGGLIAINKSHQVRPAKLALRPPATASPAPAPEASAVPATQPPVTVELKPETTSSTVHVSAKPPASAQPKTGQPKPGAEVKSAETLSSAEVQHIVDITHYESLRGRKMEVWDRFSNGESDIVMVGIDGGRPQLPAAELRQYINEAGQLAARRTSFQATVQLGPNVSRQVSFDTRPAELSEGGRSTHYFMFAPAGESLSELTSGKVAFKDAFTTADPYHKFFLSMFRHFDSGETTYEMPAASKAAATEANQSFTWYDLNPDFERQLDQEQPDMSYLAGGSYPDKKVALAKIGREVGANAAGDAMASSYNMRPYSQYSSAEPGITLRDYPNANVKLFAFPETIYNSWAPR